MPCEGPFRARGFRHIAGRKAAKAQADRMTNGIALGIGLILVAAAGADLALNDGAGLMFTARKVLGLIEWVAFWR